MDLSYRNNYCVCETSIRRCAKEITQKLGLDLTSVYQDDNQDDAGKTTSGLIKIRDPVLDAYAGKTISGQKSLSPGRLPENNHPGRKKYKIQEFAGKTTSI